MFNKTPDQTTPPSGSGSARATGAKSVFSSDLKITGEVKSLGDIEMMGEVDGNIAARSLIIGSEGRLTGTVTADQVEVRGRLEGQVTAGTFTLRAAAQATADIAYQIVVVESGALVEGRLTKTRD